MSTNEIFTSNEMLNSWNQFEEDFENLPEGEYQIEIMSLEIKKTKRGLDMHSFKLKVLGPQYAGRILFENLLLTHDNDQVKRIHMHKFKKLVSATYIDQPKTTREFIGKKVTAVIGIREDENYIKSFKPIRTETIQELGQQNAQQNIRLL